MTGRTRRDQPAARGAALVGLLLAALASDVRAEAYTLAAGDVVRLTVAGDRSLSVERTMVQSDETLLVPRVGPLAVGGLSLAEARERVQTALRGDLGIARPDATLEILEYRPFYILGDVEAPGSYPFVPGQTVVQAIARAGGFIRHEGGNAILRIEAGQLGERLAQHREQMAISLVRRARLIAERDGEALVQPEATTRHVDPARAAALLGHESALMQRRAEASEQEMAILSRLLDELDAEIAALIDKLAALENRLAILDEERDRLIGLMQRDLVPLDRQMALRRDQALANADILDTHAFIARARTQRAQVERDIAERRNGRSIEIATEIRDADDALALTRGLIESTLARLAGIDRFAAEAAARAPDPRYSLGRDRITLVRREGDASVEIGADLTDRLRPDDVLIVPSWAGSPGGTGSDARD